jgi:hypothetical protein
MLTAICTRLRLKWRSVMVVTHTGGSGYLHLGGDVAISVKYLLVSNTDRADHVMTFVI